jgi:hypothetical protein
MAAQRLRADSLWISADNGGTNGGPHVSGVNYNDFDLGYDTPFAEWSLRYRTYFGIFSGTYTLFLEGEKGFWPTGTGFDFNYIAGTSYTVSGVNALALQGGLSALLKLNGDFDLYSRWDNTFYGDSDLSYLESGARFNHFLLKPITLFLAYEVIADIPYSNIGSAAFNTTISPGVRLEFGL